MVSSPSGPSRRVSHLLFRRIAAVVGAGLACLTSTSRAQGSGSGPRTDPALITGRVLDAATLVGLPGVDVRLLGATNGVTTNEAGDFRLVVTLQGSATVVLRKLGYNPIGVPLDVSPNDSLHIATKLVRAPQTLDTLRVAGKSEIIAPPRLAGFEYRRQMNQGKFITPEQLERTASTSIGDVLRGIPSIKVTADRFGILMIESTRGMRLDRQGRPTPCRVRIMVDGFLMPLGDLPLPVWSPKVLHGIEVYSGPAQIPRELIRAGEDVGCGLVAMWTK